MGVLRTYVRTLWNMVAATEGVDIFECERVAAACPPPLPIKDASYLCVIEFQGQAADKLDCLLGRRIHGSSSHAVDGPIRECPSFPDDSHGIVIRFGPELYIFNQTTAGAPLADFTG